MVDIPSNIRFNTKQEALNYAKSEAYRHTISPGYKAARGRYWSMDLMDYVNTWIAVLIY